MNKPATKEPSMDEILSSIRQIIADDDAAAAPVPVARPPVAATAAAAPRPVTAPPRPPATSTGAPLALSPSQMLPPATPPAAPAAPREAPAAPVENDFSAMLAGLDEPEPDVSPPMAEILADEAELIDPEDVAFEMEPDPEPEPPPPVLRAPESPPRAVEPPRAVPRPAASVAQAAPMPDPTLSSDMAEELLAPATDAAVQGAMSRLSQMAGGGIGSLTVEAMIREMLRPMLKDWLDENLPSLVEGMVEKEISRISRGVK